VDKINLIDVDHDTRYDVFDVTIDKKITLHVDQKDIIVGSKRQKFPFSFIVNGEKQDYNHNLVLNIMILSDKLYHETHLIKTKSLQLHQLPENAEFTVLNFWFVTFRKKQYPAFVFTDSYTHYIDNESFTDKYNEYKIIPKELTIKYTFIYKRKNKRPNISIILIH